MTKALENSNAECFNDVSKILEEVIESIAQKEEEKTNQSNDEKPTAKKVDDCAPSAKCSVGPNEGWLIHTNTDLGLMLECAQASLALEQCDECGYTLEFGEALNDHKKSEHMGQLSKVCSNCGEFFSTINNLNEHNLAKHTPTFSSNPTCKECIRLRKIEGFKNVVIGKKDENIKQLGDRIRRMD